MNHGVRHFDTGRPAVRENAAHLAFQRGNELLRDRVVLLGDVQRRGQLTFELFQRADQLRFVGAVDDDGRSAEHFLGDFVSCSALRGTENNAPRPQFLPCVISTRAIGLHRLVSGETIHAFLKSIVRCRQSA